MILTDIYVPALNAVYDFQLDENTPVSVLIDEIVEILIRKTGGVFHDAGKNFVLCSQERETILDKDRTLTDYKIRNGSRLLIV